MKKSEIELNDNEMSINNMPAIVIPVPPPLVRSVCYLPEHYHPFLKHSEVTNCFCSFCEHERFVTEKEMKAAVQELPQIDRLIASIDNKILETKNVFLEVDKIMEDLLAATEQFRKADEMLEEEILLQPVMRSLEMPIPKLSRSTNDPNNWEPADDEEILLTGLKL